MCVCHVLLMDLLTYLLTYMLVSCLHTNPTQHSRLLSFSEPSPLFSNSILVTLMLCIRPPPDCSATDLFLDVSTKTYSALSKSWYSHIRERRCIRPYV